MSENAAIILDPCCGNRMMWFDKAQPDTVFGDIRTEKRPLRDGRTLNVAPDVLMDFTAIPFPDRTFSLVVFDPPHLTRAGFNSWLRAKYGVLGKHWEEDLRAGFAECFRVLKSDGVLIFKWNETQVPVRKVLSLAGHKPLFGHRSGKKANTHWITFMKVDP